MKILIVGGGVIGTAHAFEAIKQGHEVVQLERDEYARQASVRNFGLVWVSGRKTGVELTAAIRARQLWEEIHVEIPEMSFRANGSLTLARNQAEVTVMEECLKKVDAADRRWQLLDREQTQQINPSLKGEFLAALWCPLDATVEPGSVLSSIRSFLMSKSSYTWRNNCDVIDVQESHAGVTITVRSGEKILGDKVIFCPGADHSSLFKEQLALSPIRRVRLQMMSTAPFDEEVTTSIADGDSMRYYPGYQVPSLYDLPAQHPVAEKNHMQLLLVQRRDGSLTIGDTHEYDEPFEFKLKEDPYSYLHDLASSIFGRTLPPITNRWDGVYSQRTDGAICDRRQISESIISVTGPGGRGNTLAPAIAEETLKGL